MVYAETADTTKERLDAARSTSLRAGSLAATALRLRVNFGAFRDELLGFLFQARLQRLFLGDFLFGSILPNVFGDAHGTEVRSAHERESDV